MAMIVHRRSMNEMNFKLTLKIADIPGIQLTMADIETMAGAVETIDGETNQAITAPPTR
jgi:hypothetical protein